MNLDQVVIGIGVVAVVVTGVLYIRNYKYHHYGGKFKEHFKGPDEQYAGQAVPAMFWYCFVLSDALKLYMVSGFCRSQ